MHAYVSSVSWLLCQVIYLLSLMSVTRFFFFALLLMIYFLLKHLASFKSSTSVRVLMEFFPSSPWQHEWRGAVCLCDDGIRMIDEKKNLHVTIKIIIFFYLLTLFYF
jgi:hypothetical protein